MVATLENALPLLYPATVPSSYALVKPTTEQGLKIVLNLERFEENTGISRETLFLAAWNLTLSLHASEAVDSVVFGWQDKSGQTVPFRIAPLGPEPSVLSFLNAVDECAKEYISKEYHVQAAQVYSEHPLAKDLFQTVIATDGNLNLQYGHLLAVEMLLDEDGKYNIRILTVPDVLTPDDAAWVLQHFANALRTLVSGNALDKPVSDLNLSTHEEHDELLRRFNPSNPYQSGLAKQLRLHHIFEVQAAKTPRKIALQYERSTFLTYEELDGKADHLARLLIAEYKVEPGQIIPILFPPHSVELYVSILSVLKAGCAWMPLDDSHPDVRLQTVVRMPGNVSLVLTSPGELSERSRRIFGGAALTIIEVDHQILPLADHEFRIERTQANDLAYILFTSGSTGEPKGVCVEHSHIVSAAIGWKDLWPKGLPFARCLQFSGATFDPSVLDIFLILGTGGTLCLGSKNTLADLNNALGPLFDATFLYTVPTVAKFIDPSLVPALSDLTIVGEPITAALRDTWASRVRLLNTYGPSEISVVATAMEIDPHSDIRLIGWAYGDNELLILDDNLELVPYGAIGEICLSGPQLTRGYLRNVAQTDKYYVPHPFRSDDRLYRTGDLGRRRADGSVEFVGRRDHQVKFRGIRLELEEISEVLARHPKVETAVVNKVTRNGKEELVAFIGLLVPVPSSSPSLALLPADSTTITLLSELRHLTLEHLPLPLNPTIFLPFEALPCTPNGKTDRRRLSNFYLEAELGTIWQYNQGTSDTEIVLPTTQNELTLRRAWAEVLKIEETRFGIAHKWYELGGDSISAVTLSTLLRAHGLELLPVDVTRVQTLREQAAIAIDSVDIETSVLDSLPDTLETATHDQLLPLLEVSDVQLKHIIDVTIRNHGLRAAQVVDLFPCTPLQESMIAANLERSDAYVIQNSYALPDNLDVERLRNAIIRLVEVTPALRTVFLLDSNVGFLSAVLSTETAAPFSVISVADSTLFETASDPFGSSFPPDSVLLTRAVLIQSHEDSRTRSRLIWTFHHALLDGWSIAHLEADLQQLYEGRNVATRPSFKHFLHDLRGRNLMESTAFWRQRLVSVQPTVFPFDTTNNRVTANSSLTATFTIGYQRLVQLHGIKLSTLVSAAWALVLAAHSGSQDEVVFGHVNWGRGFGLAGVENIVGPCLNTIAHNIVIPKEGTVLDFLRYVQSDQALLDEHSLVALRSISIPDIATLFRTILNFYQLPASSNASESPLLSQLSEVDGVDYPLVVFATAQDSDIHVEVRFAETQIVVEDAQLVLNHFGQALLELASSSPSRLLTAISLSNEFEVKAIAQDAALKPLQLPLLQDLGITGVHHLIEQQASSIPNKIALQYEQEHYISYRQLDQLANRLAQTLIKYVVPGHERLIPICFNKGVDMIVSILAVLKAGCGYVPIDAEGWGPDRINVIVGISKAQVCLVGPDLHEKMSKVLSDSSLTLLKVDALSLQPSTDKLAAGRVLPSDIAYVLFTSGSTGTPKGVIIEHQAIIESALASRDVFGQRSDRVLQFSAYTFDVSCWDFFATLTGGGRLCLAARDNLLSDLTSVMRDMDIQFLETTPTVASLLSKPIDSLQVLTVSGESLSSQVKETWASEVLLVNCFGPTEAAVNVTYQHVSPTTPNNNIGRRFGPNLTYVLADVGGRLSPVPVGCVGELYLGGPQVGRGYLNNAEQTSRAFLPNPFVSKHEIHNRLYKTGDLVRRQVNGDLIYLGRKDAQVKLRGLRIELSEIEHVISAASPKVTGAVVEKVASRGQEELVAFVSLLGLEASTSEDLVAPVDIADAFVPLVEEIRGACSQKLPAYMVPSLFIPLHHIPTTSAGKADRKRIITAFKLIDASIVRQFNGLGSLDSNDSRSSPETELHTTLRALWAIVLNLSENSLGIDDDWFRAGGDSIGAIRLATAAREAGLHLLATDVIRNPTIRSQAHAIELAIINHEYDTDDVPSVSSLAEMQLTDLPLLNFTQELLDKLRTEVLPKHGISVQDVTDVYPCTPLQTAMLVASALVSDAYLVREEYELAPGTDGARLKQAVHNLINHVNGACLRTIYVSDPSSNNFLQLVMRPGWKEMEWRTVSLNDESELGDAIAEYHQTFGGRRFGDAEIMTRACVFEVRGVPRRLVWIVHHTAEDAWTKFGYESDVMALYKGDKLPERRAFKTLIKYLSTLDRTAGLDFWKNKLLTATPSPFLQPPPGAERTTVNTSITRRIHPGHSTLAREYGIMASTLATAAWALVLAAHTGSSDVVFGQPVAGRSAPIGGIEEMVGTCINTVARRVIFDPTVSILDTLREIQADQVEIAKHEYIGLAEIQRHGVPDIGGLFRTLLNIRNLPGDQELYANEDKRKAEPQLLTGRGGLDGADVPLVIFVSPYATDSFALEVLFTKQIVSPAEIELLLDHFEAALFYLNRNPYAPIHNVNFVNAREAEKLLPRVNPALIPTEGVTGIHHLIEQQAKLNPDKIALQYEQQHFVTYRQMNELANSLAQTLTQYTVPGDERIVPICFNKSIDMVISILAVLKAGCGYVPIDAEGWGHDRINTIIDISRAQVCLVGADLHDKMSAVLSESPLTVLKVDALSLEPSQVRPKAGRVLPTDLAYVLFTSGSTGTPKGVMIEHQAIIQSALASRDVFGRRSDRVLQFSAYTFDVSCWDFFATLTGGGRLCLASRDHLLTDLTSVMRDMDIQFLETTPTVASLLSKPLDSLRVLTVSGESLSSQVKETWADEVLLVNCFGPTEAAVNVTYQHVSPSTPNNNIGQQFGPNTTYVLNDSSGTLVPVPIGCVGELYLGGPQVGRGYLNNAKQTSDAFLVNPFIDKGEVYNRLYKTGDLVRREINGNLTYLGRKDAQIKLRGLRIELSEIEHIISASSLKVTGVVVEKVATRGQEELAAFVSLADLETLSDDLVAPVDIANDFIPLVEEIRAVCSQKLPVYMVPSLFIPLRYIPTTSAGKADRKRIRVAFDLVDSSVLRAFNGFGTSDSSEDRTLPETELHATLRSLWAIVLNLSENALGIDDDWFRAGGDSIGAIRLATAAREAGLHLLATDVIRNTTIRSQAQVVELSVINHDYDTDNVPSVSSLAEMELADLPLVSFTQDGLDRLRNEVLPRIGISAHDVSDAYPSTSLQASMLFASAVAPDAYLVREEYDLAPGTDSTRLKQAFNDLINHANGACLRTIYVFDTLSNNFLQLVMRPGWKEMEWRTVSLDDEAGLDDAIAEYHQTFGGRRFEEAEMMTRACLFEVGGCPRRLVWIVHHAAEDAWTKYGYESDVKELYKGNKLPDRRAFKTLIKYILSLDRAAGLDFWKKKLLTATPSLFLQPDPGAQRATANTWITRRVHPGHSALAREYGVMASTLATAAWALVLAAHTGSLDVVFGQPVTGRSAPIRGIEEMVGVCINTVARRVILDPAASVIDTLRAIQADQVEITKYEYIGLAEIQRHGVSDVGNLVRTLLNIRNLPGDQELYANEDRPRAEPELLTGRGGSDGVDVALDLFVSPYAGKSFALEVLFTKEVISPAEVEIILDHYEAALFYMTSNPNELIQNVNLVNPREAETLLPQTRPLITPRNVTGIHHLIEQQARIVPHKIALQYEQEHFITYRQMDELANSLADVLAQYTVPGDERLIPICFNKGVDMVISILAVLKAGCGYIPLDAEGWGNDRLNTIIDISKARVCLVGPDLYHRMSKVLSDTSLTLLKIDALSLEPSALQPVSGKVLPSDLAYVLFTSGSTGTPKGVMIEHRAIIESALASRDVFGQRSDRVLQFSAYTFDVSCWDFFATLTGGGRLCLASRDHLLSDLTSVMRDMDIQFLETTPTVASLLSKPLDSLRVLTVSGEPLSSQVKETWANEVLLVNCFGPTEAAVNVTYQHVSPTTSNNNIGERFGTNLTYVLSEMDGTLSFVPVGCIGELYLGGPQVGRGYLNNPEQTSRTFLTNPFVAKDEIHNRLYRTGDLVRREVDGNLTYLGRKDAQIKLRGLRIELSEIEHVISAASLKVTGVVVEKVATRGQEELAAFVSLADLETLSDDLVAPVDIASDFVPLVEEVRGVCLQKLPVYMVPSLFIPLHYIPTTSAGKADRKRIRSAFDLIDSSILRAFNGFGTSDSSEGRSPPETELHIILRSLWAAVLNLSDNTLGIDDDWFRAGGDSIGAIRLATAAREAGLHLLATDVIRNTTIRTQAHVVEAAVINHDYDTDDVPSVSSLAKMELADLPLVSFTQDGLDRLRNEVLPRIGVSAHDVVDVYPSTSLQASMLFASAVVPDAYLVREEYDLAPGTDSTRLKQAFNDLVNHANGACLRTIYVFDTLSNNFLQLVLRPGWKEMEWRTVSLDDEAGLDDAIAEYHQTFGGRRFEEAEIMTRACLFEVGGYPRRLVWVVHHAAEDAWTKYGYESDVKELYKGNKLPDRRAFKTLIKYILSLDRAAGLDFWKKKLLTATPSLFLQPDPGAQRATANTWITRRVHPGHSALAREYGVMASTLATAAWALVLAAHTGSLDVVFGQPVTGRSAPIRGIEEMVGVCINTVARRVILDPAASVIDTLRAIQADQVEITKYEYTGLAEIQRHGVSDVGNLVRTLLNIRNLPGDQELYANEDRPRAEPELLTGRDGSDGVDVALDLFVSPYAGKSFALEILFAKEVISPAEVEIILDHYEAALFYMTSNPNELIQNVNLVNVREAEKLLPQPRPLISPRDVTGIHHLIEQQARIIPHKIALQYEKEHFITYRQMDELANSLAQTLTQYTVPGEERIIPICFNKSVDMVISILAVLKAGCGYVPIDAEGWGHDRINTIIGISRAQVCLVGADLYDKMSTVLSESPSTVLKVDALSLEPSQIKPEAGRVLPTDLAYVLFTSGSTGTPKGVMIEHQAIIQSALASRDVFGRRSDRVLQFSAYTFDVSCWDFFATLTGGGRLCLASRDHLLTDLTSVMRDMDIQFLETTPTVASLLSKPLDSLRVLTVSGESLSSQVKETWADEVLLVNCFGPTEAAVNVTYQHVSPSTPNNNIGQQFGTNATYVLSDNLVPVPIGCVGELYLGGPQVGRGYLNNAKQTSDAFLVNPFVDSDEVYNRLYKTGDLVRREVDGNLTYLGRKDAQIKLRGLRIELSEIEHVISAASLKVTGVVVEKVASRGQEELAAFVSLSDLEILSDDLVAPVDIASDFVSLVEEIRGVCLQKLPVYMVPSLFVPLHYIPTTSAGKADRKRIRGAFDLIDSSILRAFNGFGTSDSSEGRSPPETELHTTLRSLWATVLNLSENALGIDDDWFRAGGDSIGAIRLATAAREAGLHLLATDVIRNTTIRTQAHVAEAAVINHDYDTDDVPSVSSLAEMELADLPLVNFTQDGLNRLRNEILPKHGISAQDVTDVYPCTPLQTSMLVASAIVSDAYLVREDYDLAPGMDSARLKQAFSDLVNHPNGACLRTLYVFDTSSNSFLQLLMRPGWKEMDWRTVLLDDESELEAATAEYHEKIAGQRFGDAEIMARACLFEVGGRPRRLVWIVHHAAEDAWTKYGYESDVKTLYKGEKLPERRAFKTLIKYLSSLDRTASLDFWKNKLLTATPSPFLQQAPGAKRTTVSIGVGRRVHPGHSALAREYGIMASTLITTAWALVLAAYTGSSDVVFGQVIAGRSAPIRGIEEMAGTCINTVARRVILNSDASIIETLRKIQADQVEIAKHEYIGLAEIQHHGIPDIGGLFRTLLNIRNLPGDQELYANESKPTAEPDLLTGRGGTDGDDIPLDLFVSPYGSDSFALDILFSKEIISAEEVEILLDHYEAALFHLTHHPNEPIRNVNLVSAREAEKLLMNVVSNDQSPVSAVNNIHQLIEEQAQRTPQRIAIQFEQQTFLTYAQLDALANGLAQTLLDRGVKRGDIIGLYTDKSAELFINILAIHKVGAAYCPLDPEHPASRIQTIVIDLAQSKLVLTSKELEFQISDILGSSASTLVIDIRDIKPLTEKPKVEAVGREDICHVLFTSGTSGVPKGVVLTHGAIIESAVASVEVFGRRDDRVLQFSNYTFDVSVWDWSATLTAGGTLCIAPKKRLMENLGAVAKEFDATFLETTPTVAALITPQEIPSLYTLTVSGEVLTPEVRAAWASDVTLVNCYGPTECATNSLAMKCVTSTTEGSNIGHPFGRNAIYILDEQYRLVPMGCVGELFIGGPQVARGYLRNEEQTAKVFVNDPFRPGSMMYATGDLVRMNITDGSITYLGRRDTQIKIRGLRVEVGEIEHVLKATNSTVTNAAVIKVNIGHEELIAFLECAVDDDDATAIRIMHDDALIASLKTAAARRLPSYMVPSRFVVLNRFPLASSGKLDRKALDAFFHANEQSIRTQHGHGVVNKATTTAEKKIMKLWQNVLKMKEEIDVHATFADMGGDSVGMMRLSGLAFKKGISLTIADQLERTTIREQSALVVSKK